MGLLDSLFKSDPAQDAAIDPQYQVSNGLVRQARYDQLGALGGALMAAGAKQSPDSAAQSLQQLGPALSGFSQRMSGVTKQAVEGQELQQKRQQYDISLRRLQALRDPAVLAELQKTFPGLTPAMLQVMTPDKIDAMLAKSKVLMTDDEKAQQAATLELTRANVDEHKRKAGAPITMKPGETLLDPKTMQPVAKSDSGSLTPDAVDFAARQILFKGDMSALNNMGRGAQGPQNIAAIRNRVTAMAAENNMDATEASNNIARFGGQKSAERTLGGRAVNFTLASEEANGALSMGEEMSKAVPRGQWVPLNLAEQQWAKSKSNPALGAFVASNNAIINTYARAISPTGQPTVADKEHAREQLSTATSHEQYMAVLKTMRREMEIAHKAIKKTFEHADEFYAGKGGAGEKPAGDGWSIK
jgi:hypothetical protein